MKTRIHFTLCFILATCGGSLISRWLVATAYHCVDIEKCKFKRKKCKTTGWVSQDPPRLCDPSNGKFYVTVGAHYTHKFIRQHKIPIKEVHAPSKRGNKHDFAIMVLNEPVRDILVEWKQGICYMLFAFAASWSSDSIHISKHTVLTM